MNTLVNKKQAVQTALSQRGGRLIKCKGVLVSMAPHFGAVALVVSGVATPAFAVADTSCGAPVANGTVTCNPTTYKPAVPANGGIIYKDGELDSQGNPIVIKSGLTLDIDLPGVDIANAAATIGARIELSGTSADPLTIHIKNLGKVNSFTFPVFVSNAGTGDANVIVDGGTYRNNADLQGAIRAHGTGTGNVNATFNDGVITVEQSGFLGRYGVYAEGIRNTTITMNGGLIQSTTGGINYRALMNISYSQNKDDLTATYLNGGKITSADHAAQSRVVTNGINGLAGSLIRMTGGEIDLGPTMSSSGLYIIVNNANNAAAHRIEFLGGKINFAGKDSGNPNNGMNIRNFGTGSSDIVMDQPDPNKPAPVLNMAGDDSIGANFETPNANNNSDTTFKMKAGEMNQSGDRNIGVNNVGNGTGDANVDVSGKSKINTPGVDSTGIKAHRTNGDYHINIGDEAQVNGGSGKGAGIQGVANEGHGGEINIDKNATVGSGGNGAPAIKINDLNNDGVDENKGDATINNKGTINGDVKGGDGHNTFNWTDGHLNGNYAGGKGKDDVNVSSPFYDGTKTKLDGGLDAAGTNKDNTLTFSNVDGKANGANLPNWENINLDKSKLDLQDNMIKVGTLGDPNTGINVKNNSNVTTPKDFTLDGNLNIDPTSSWTPAGAGNGTTNIKGNVNNDGQLGKKDGTVGDNIVIDGNYHGGPDSKISLDTDLSTGKSDKINIKGDASGKTNLELNNLNQGPMPTTPPNLDFLNIGGKKDLDIKLLGDYKTKSGEDAVVLGAYSYVLRRDANGNWYLDSTAANGGRSYQPSTVVYQAYTQSLLALSRLPTFSQRTSSRATNRNQSGVPTGDAYGRNNGAWAQVTGETGSYGSTGTIGKTAQNRDLFLFQGGYTRDIVSNSKGSLSAGPVIQYGNATSKMDADGGSGSVRTSGYGAGAALTWESTNGWYLDSQAMFNWYESKLVSDQLGVLAKANRARGYSLSLEGGKQFVLRSPDLTLTPQMQVYYASVQSDSFADKYGLTIAADRANKTVLRTGAVLQQDLGLGKPGGKLTNIQMVLNVYQTLSGAKTTSRYAGLEIYDRPESTIGELGVGGNIAWGKNGMYALSARASVFTGLQDFGKNTSVAGTAALTVRW